MFMTFARPKSAGSSFEYTITSLMLLHLSLQLRHLLLTRNSRIPILAQTHPSQLLIQAQMSIRMSICLNINHIRHHQILRNSHNILNQSITHTYTVSCIDEAGYSRRTIP
jgi:hypothetical protein